MHEFTKGGITERLRQLGSRKAFHVQIFDAHRIKAYNQAKRLFVQPISALVANALVGFG
jgi:hypothetical protein